MHTNAQASIFISLAIVLLFGAGFVLFLMNSDESSTESSVSKVNSIEEAVLEIDSFVDSCIKLIAEPLVESISQKGGRFEPGSGIIYKNEELTVLCTEEVGLGCVNSLLMRQDIEKQLSDRIVDQLASCVDLSIFSKRGITIKTGELAVETTIERDTVSVTAHYPMKLELNGIEDTIESFVEGVDFPLGRLYGAAIDIINIEAAQGQFDKNRWMMEHGFEILIEKSRPYPNIIYELIKVDTSKNKNFTFQFAVKGFDSVASVNARQPTQSGGCCINSIDSFCFKNAPAAGCRGDYIATESCVCEAVTETIFSGCCITEDACFASSQEECTDEGSQFVQGDIACQKCNKNNCKKTWIPADGDFTGPERKHGESWCVYDAITGYGLDYVGSRHYVHTCLNGEEIVEECRDFREEICIENFESSIQSASCRVNRWHDCALQLSASSCEDRSRRDCLWWDNLRLNRDSKCVPHVPPGFRFWEGNGQDVCNSASEDPTDFQRWARPRSWGHSTALYCQYMGDCGNYRNLFGDITKLGYFNSYGEPREFIYNEEGHEKKGHQYNLNLPIRSSVATVTAVPGGSRGSFATCNVWQPPNRNDQCEQCTERFKVCSEYRCKSIGRACEFSIVDNKGVCTSTGVIDTEKPAIVFDESLLTFGYSVESSDNNYYGAKEHKITPKVNPYQPITFGFTTSKPSRCKVSLRPPNIPRQLWQTDSLLGSLPQGGISNSFQERHNLTIRFPDKTLGNFTRFLLFVSCTDKFGNENNDETYLDIEIKDPPVLVPPKILSVEPNPETLGVTNEHSFIRLFVNKPFRECRYSSLNIAFDSMKDSFKCNTTVYDMSFIPGTPLGSFQCNSQLPLTKHRFYFNCKDWLQRTATENYEYSIP